MPIDPHLFAATVAVKARVERWQERFRLAWWVLSGQEFTLRVYADDITVSKDTTPEGVAE